MRSIRFDYVRFATEKQFFVIFILHVRYAILHRDPVLFAYSGTDAKITLRNVTEIVNVARTFTKITKFTQKLHLIKSTVKTQHFFAVVDRPIQRSTNTKELPFYLDQKEHLHPAT